MTTHVHPTQYTHVCDGGCGAWVGTFHAELPLQWVRVDIPGTNYTPTITRDLCYACFVKLQEFLSKPIRPKDKSYEPVPTVVET
jgi:hypothetical protein